MTKSQVRQALAQTKWALLRRASRIRQLREFILDARRYAKISTPTMVSYDQLSGLALECHATKEYHRIEKGLSLRNPRNPFGAEPQSRLQMMLAGRPREESHDFLRFSREAIIALDQWNSAEIVSDTLTRNGEELKRPSLAIQTLRDFFATRRSIRSFDPSRDVAVESVIEGVQMAQGTPSVCNRQSGRVHYYVGKDVQSVLALHNGSGGFRDEVPAVLVVTVDSRLFSGTGERNQRWVDGGLFAMTLVWALHGLGLGTCMLNWSRSNSDSEALRSKASIPSEEDIIALIAVGHPAPGFRYARSPRRPLSTIFTQH
jgi:nitroreductase